MSTVAAPASVEAIHRLPPPPNRSDSPAPGGGHGPGRNAAMDAVSDLLGVTPLNLQKMLSSGMSPSEIVTAVGLAPSSLIASIVATLAAARSAEASTPGPGAPRGPDRVSAAAGAPATATSGKPPASTPASPPTTSPDSRLSALAATLRMDPADLRSQLTSGASLRDIVAGAGSSSGPEMDNPVGLLYDSKL